MGNSRDLFMSGVANLWTIIKVQIFSRVSHILFVLVLFPCSTKKLPKFSCCLMHVYLSILHASISHSRHSIRKYFNTNGDSTFDKKIYIQRDQAFC